MVTDIARARFLKWKVDYVPDYVMSAGVVPKFHGRENKQSISMGKYSLILLFIKLVACLSDRGDNLIFEEYRESFVKDEYSDALSGILTEHPNLHSAMDMDWGYPNNLIYMVDSPKDPVGRRDPYLVEARGEHNPATSYGFQEKTAMAATNAQASRLVKTSKAIQRRDLASAKLETKMVKENIVLNELWGKLGRRPPRVQELRLRNGTELFMNNLHAFRSYLMGGPLALANLDERLLESAQADGKLILQNDKTMRWMPVHCFSIGMRIKKSSLPFLHTPQAYLQKVLEERTDRIYLMKTFEDPDAYTAELAVYMLSNHPFIARPICVDREGVYSSETISRPQILFEYTRLGRSSDWAQRPDATVAALGKLSAQLLDALLYLHHLGFGNGALAAENIFVQKDSGSLLLMDFAHAAPIPLEPAPSESACRAPEQLGLVTGRVGVAADFWSLGQIIASWHLAKHLLPETSEGRVEDFDPFLGTLKGDSVSRYPITIQSASRPDFMNSAMVDKFSPGLRELLAMLTTPNPLLRRFSSYSGRKLLKGIPFFDEINWDELETVEEQRSRDNSRLIQYIPGKTHWWLETGECILIGDLRSSREALALKMDFN